MNKLNVVKLDKNLGPPRCSSKTSACEASGLGRWLSYQRTKDSLEPVGAWFRTRLDTMIMMIVVGCFFKHFLIIKFINSY